MYTDGESITYRTDRAQRGGMRRYTGSSARYDESAQSPAYGLEPTSVSTQTGPSRRIDPAAELSEGLGKLRSMADRLEQGLQRLEGVVGDLMARAGTPPDTRSVVQQEEAPVVQMLRNGAVPERGPEQVAEVARPLPEVKVSMFTGGEAMAILGQVRVLRAEE